MNNFANILDAPTSGSDWDRPPPLPRGSYVCMINGMPERGVSDKKQTPFIRFQLKFLQALDDVDTDELDSIGGLSDKTMPLTFFITDKSKYRFGEFLRDDLGLDLEEGVSPWVLAQQAPGSQVLVTIRHKPTEDGKGVYAEIAGTAAVG